MKKLLFCLAILAFLVANQASAAITKDLKYGMTGDAEVTELQEFLTSEGLYSGPITGNFYSLTLKAVKSFQSREGITPVSGYVGTKTRARLNTFLDENVAVDENTIPVATSSAAKDSIQAQLNLLLQQLQALQAQSKAQEQTNETLQNVNQNLQNQQNTLNQIVNNTTSTPPSQPSAPVAPTPVQKTFVLAYKENDNNGYKITNSISATVDVTKSTDDMNPLIFALVFKEGNEYMSSPQVYDIQVSAPDSSQSKTIGTSNSTNGLFLDGYKFTGSYASYGYFPRATGTNTITFTSPSLGVTKSITINVVSP